MIEIRQLPQPPSGTYLLAPDDITVRDYLDGLCASPSLIAIDTEDGPDGTWSVQVSGMEGTGVMILTSSPHSVARLRDYIIMHHPVVIMHNALHDLPKLQSLGINPPLVDDTMVMAYLLQDEPLGLKPLACRHANVKMRSYVEVIGSARWEKAMEYLDVVKWMEWPDPEQIIVWEKGIPRVTQPQNIGKKAKRAFDDVTKGNTKKDGSLIHPRERWMSIKADEGRGMVEEMLGPMPDGYLLDVPREEAVEYGCCDADMTLRVYHALMARLEEMDMTHLLAEEEGVMRFANMMHKAGIPASRERFREVSDELQEAMDGVELEIQGMTGWTGQLSSHPQVSRLIWDDLALRPNMPKRSKKMGKTMTGVQVLSQVQHLHAAIPLIMKWKKLDKLKNTYADGVPRWIEPDGRIRATFRTTNTDTGRMSCADPNLMAQPKRDKEWAKKIRSAFIAPDEWRFLSMDYSQIELRLTADTAGEAFMIRAFQEGIDLHAGTALEMFHGLKLTEMATEDILEKIPEVNKLTERLPAKTINFGIIYGIGADGLYRNMVTMPGCEHWTVELAQQYIDAYMAARPGIRGYIDDTVSMARRYGYVWDWTGRIRRIPGAKLKNEYKRAEAERQACNARIQTGAGSIFKAAMCAMEPYYREWAEKGWATPAIPIHDDIVSLVHEDHLEEVVKIQKPVMEGVKRLSTGIRVDVEYGRNWGAMKDWEGDDDE